MASSACFSAVSWIWFPCSIRSTRASLSCGKMQIFFHVNFRCDPGKCTECPFLYCFLYSPLRVLAVSRVYNVCTYSFPLFLVLLKLSFQNVDLARCVGFCLHQLVLQFCYLLPCLKYAILLLPFAIECLFGLCSENSFPLAFKACDHAVESESLKVPKNFFPQKV